MPATRRRANAGDRGVAAGLGEEPERLDGQVVVLLVERVAAGLGDREDLGGTAAAAGAVDARLAGLDGALGEHVVEVAADGGGGEVQPLARARPPCSGRARASSRATRSRVGASASAARVLHFHNTIVSLLRAGVSNKASLTSAAGAQTGA